MLSFFGALTRRFLLFRGAASQRARISIWGRRDNRREPRPVGTTGARRLNPNSCALCSLQFEGYLVMNWSPRRTVKWIVGRIAGKAFDVNFCTTISLDLSLKGPAVRLSFRAILIVKYPILNLAGELVSIGAPNPFLFAEFFDYPNSIEHVRCRRAGFR